MTKAELKELMNEYIMANLKEVYTSIEFVNELLYRYRKEEEKRHPKLKFEDLQLAECWVLNMIEFVESIMEDDNNEG